MKITSKMFVEFTAEEIAEILKEKALDKLKSLGTVSATVTFNIISKPIQFSAGNYIEGMSVEELKSATITVS